jgi:hypothetical protein
MRDIIHGQDGLPRNVPGGYVAWLDDQVVMIADTYDDLLDRLDQTSVDESRVVIGYVEPTDAARIFSPRVVSDPECGW